VLVGCLTPLDGNINSVLFEEGSHLADWTRVVWVSGVGGEGEGLKGREDGIFGSMKAK